MNNILKGDALTRLKELPEKSVNMCMTSPPYWALRDYGIEGQLGLEPTFDEYINKLCDIFDEVKRVLRDDGTCWVNLGDTYSGGDGGSRWDTGKKLPLTGGSKKLKLMSKINKSHKYNHSLQSKCLTLIPFRFTIEMINRGWILRNTIIWHKPNCMPSSVKDRFTVDFEYLFFFSKKKKYYFETQREPHKLVSVKRIKRGFGSGSSWDCKDRVTKSKRDEIREKGITKGMSYDKPYLNPEGRTKRCVWEISPKPFKEAHFAVYPEELCETPIKAGCPEGGIVLDPFFGAGTTGLVALKQNKKFIGIELNEEYIKIAKKRLKPLLEQTKLL